VTDSKRDDISGLACLALISQLVLGGYFAWKEASDTGWVPHSTLAIVSFRAPWSTGEYKSCKEANVSAMKEEPHLECSGFGEGRESKRFKVQFYGATSKEEWKDKVDLVWRCRKNEGTDPTFTCEDQKIIKSEEQH